MSALLRRLCRFNFATAPKTVSTQVDPSLKTYTITLANPSKRNTLSLETLSQFAQAIDQAQSHIKSSSVKVLPVPQRAS